jgi:ribose transport system ATP-binding protein
MPASAITAVNPLLNLKGVSKRFPGVQALTEMRLEVRAGEVHAVVGENGAGKSTLMHILAGVYQPDEGRIDFAGQEDVRVVDERAAQHLGIAIVYQERSLFGSLSIAENIFAGRQPVRFANWIDRHRMENDARKLLQLVKLDLPPGKLLSDLSSAEQQLVEIAKALSLNPRLIIFDEPTAALTERETQTLFEVIRGLKAAGTAVIYISHRLEEVFAVCDRVTVLKDGRWQMTAPATEATPQMLVRGMVGRDLPPVVRDARFPGDVPPALQVKALADDPAKRASGTRLKGVSFTVHPGEIVALAGLSGAGRTETALAVFGARPFAAGQIELNGRPARIRSVAEAISAGIGYLPEDRKQAGLFLDMSIAKNMAAASLSRFGKVLTSGRGVNEAAERYRQRLNIACHSLSQAVGTLSGGNQQKVLLAKWLLVEPRVLLVDEPTRGVDVGAKFEVHRLLVELAERGTAIVLISSDLTEVLSLSDRIIVMAQGRVAGELNRAEATEERIIHLASGGANATDRP